MSNGCVWIIEAQMVTYFFFGGVTSQTFGKIYVQKHVMIVSGPVFNDRQLHFMGWSGFFYMGGGHICQKYKHCSLLLSTL